MRRRFLLFVGAAVAVVACATLAVFVPPAAADGELWVRTYRGGPTNTPDQVLHIAVHPSGEITTVGLSCNDVLILRLSPEGKQLWSQVESGDYMYSSGARVVACGEDAVVTADFLFPYYGISSSIYRYDHLGNVVWSHEKSVPVLDMVGDGDGGVVLSGTNDIGDICPCHGYITHYDRQGQVIWSDRFPSWDWPGGYFRGVMGPLAADSTMLYVAGEVQEMAGNRHFLRKYSLAGKLNWEREVRPGIPGVGITEIAPSSAEGTVALGGFSSEGPWLARHGPAGEPLWLRKWPASCPVGEAPQLASTADGVTYAALSFLADPAGSDIRLTAFSPMGGVLWEVSYDSGPLSSGGIADVALAPDGSILVLGTSGDSILLLKVADTGKLIWASRFDAGIARGAAFAIDPADRVLVGGSITFERSADFLVLAFDAAGEPRELARFNRTVGAELSRSVGVHVCPDGAVISAVGTRAPCAGSLDLIGYSHDGSHSWTRIHPGFHQFGFSTSGSSFIGTKLGSTIELTSYDSAGDLMWSHRFESVADTHLEGLTVSTAGDKIVLLDKGVCTSALIAIGGEGDELWRQDLSALRAIGPTLAPDGRVYLRRLVGDRLEIDCFDPDGNSEWTRIVEELGYPEGVDIAAGPNGAVYASGHFVRNAERDWATIRLFPGGSTDWIAHQSGGTGPTNLPVRLLLYPEGGVVGAGSVRTGESNDIVAFRYGEDGALLWRKSIAKGSVGFSSGLVVDRAGNVLIVVAVENSDQNLRATRTLKYGPGGELVWSREFRDRRSNFYRPTVAVGPDLSVAVSGSAAGDSAFTLVYAPPLPVEITALAAEWINHDVRLTWSVGSGLEPAGFSVLYSASHVGPFQTLGPTALPGESREYLHRAVPPGEAHYILEVIEPDGSLVRHGPVLANAGAPASLWLLGPNPNPARGPIAWRLGLPAPSRVRIVVHDLNGRVIASVGHMSLAAGVHTIPWDTRLADGSPAPAGVYFYRIEVGEEARVGKLVLSSPR